ncbi:MAG: thioredoxin family protein [Melioribacteraceae bacterium]|nr:thioredoxin family protein [Melioribacteraceae bacterium]
MTLQTNLTHAETASDLQKLIDENENVMVCCGRMGPMCLPVYGIMERLENTYENVKFADMLFDSPEAAIIRNHPACKGFAGLPFTMYYKNGEVVEATTSIQTKEQITEILDDKFAK